MDKRVKVPQILGHEVSGVVKEVGENVSDYSPGDRVVVCPLDSRGELASDRGFSHICKNLKFLGIDSPGGLQGSWTVPSGTLYKVPDGLDLKLAALAEPLAVACHDVRRGRVSNGELVIVLGGGPIGLLVALVAKKSGARVILSEVNEHRLKVAKELGLESANPMETDLRMLCEHASGGAGADVVFEVSGSKSAVASMTGLLGIRGRLVVVAIHPQPVEINLFDFFWKELEMLGARVYESADYEAALQLLGDTTLPFEKMITRVEPIENVPEIFQTLESHPDTMKILIDCKGAE